MGGDAEVSHREHLPERQGARGADLEQEGRRCRRCDFQPDQRERRHQMVRPSRCAHGARESSDATPLPHHPPRTLDFVLRALRSRGFGRGGGRQRERDRGRRTPGERHAPRCAAAPPPSRRRPSPPSARRGSSSARCWRAAGARTSARPSAASCSAASLMTAGRVARARLARRGARAAHARAGAAEGPQRGGCLRHRRRRRED